MLPQPRWAGRPTWRLLNSSDSVSPFSSGSSTNTNLLTHDYSKARLRDSGDASTLAGSESSSSRSVQGCPEVPPNAQWVYDGQHQQSMVGTCDGPCGPYYGPPCIENGYYPTDSRVNYAQPPMTAAPHGYYNATHLYSGVYYSAPAPSFGTLVEGSSSHGDCSPNSDVPLNSPVTYPPQYCYYPEVYAGQNAHGMVQSWQGMPVGQHIYPATQYQQPPQQFNTSALAGSVNCHSSQCNGVYTMPTRTHQEDYSAAHVALSSWVPHCSKEQSFPPHPHRGVYQGRWEVEPSLCQPYGYPTSSAAPYYEGYYHQSNGHMMQYYHTRMPAGTGQGGMVHQVDQPPSAVSGRSHV